MAASKGPRGIVLTLEQALSMSYGTLRLVQDGFRVIRLEPTPIPGRRSKGDPNRAIGREVAGPDRCSYYVAPNVGKEAVAINLKDERGRHLLHRLIRELPVDAFCTNTLPAHHPSLGIDYETLSSVKPDLVVCAISCMGLDHPDVPGYDPMLQALCGYMDLTGHRDGPPLQCGLPIIDLKAGDEAYFQVRLALAEGGGKQIDISMAAAALSWLQTFAPLLDMGSPPEELRRSGNRHRQFIPVDGYKTADGYIYIAIGSDAQWHRFTSRDLFSPLAKGEYATNEGRRQGGEELFSAIEAITSRHPYERLDRELAGIPHAPITPIERVFDLPFAKPLETTTPSGAKVRLPPPAVGTSFLEESAGDLRFAPDYGEDTDAILSSIGVAMDEIAVLRRDGVVA